jgi:hypothetical protein
LAASVEVDAAGSKIKALEGEEWTSGFSIFPTITLGPGDYRDLPAGLSIFFLRRLPRVGLVSVRGRPDVRNGER